MRAREMYNLPHTIEYKDTLPLEMIHDLSADSGEHRQIRALGQET